jgi:predicted dehydrogenase
LHRLSYFDNRDQYIVRGWLSIHVTDGDIPKMYKSWVPGLQIGYEHSFVHHVADFLGGIAKNRPTSPTFREALETQKVCDAVLASAKTGQWVDVA